jgi:hypothetical protein
MWFSLELWVLETAVNQGCAWNPLLLSHRLWDVLAFITQFRMLSPWILSSGIAGYFVVTMSLTDLLQFCRKYLRTSVGCPCWEVLWLHAGMQALPLLSESGGSLLVLELKWFSLCKLSFSLSLLRPHLVFLLASVFT